MTLSQFCAKIYKHSSNMAENSNDSVIEKLKELGFTHHEALIYLAALKHGEASAGVILDEVKLHREQVYRALKRLVDDGVLTQFEKRKRSYYSPVDPTILVNKTKEKVAVAESLEPFLKKLHLAKPQTIRVWEGEDALKNHLENMLETLPEEGEYLILGAAGEQFYEEMKKYGDYFPKRFERKKIKGRIIYFEGEMPPTNSSFGEVWSAKRIKRPSVSPVTTVIFGDTVVLEWIKSDSCTVISIENEELAQSYKQTFEALWG